MHDDLRRRALESGKTTSNKSKSKSNSRNGSRANSTPNSRSASRAESREPSDNEDDINDNLSEDTNLSINSIDALLDSDDFNEETSDAMKKELEDCMAEMLDRKGSHNKGREDNLSTYVKLLTAHYLADVLHGKVDALLVTLSRSIKTESSEKETTLALKAVELTAITFEDETLYEKMAPAVKRAVTDSPSNSIKAAAIYALGTITSFGGAGDEEMAENMTFLLEIATTDGAFVDADDSADVVIAALQTYGFLATQVDDLESESEDVIAAFLDQLDSSHPHVQIAAGENMALLYEKSYTPLEDDETLSDVEDEQHDSEEETAGPSLVKRYKAYHNVSEVLDKCSSLASLSTRAMNKRDKRTLHQSFAAISTTIENPKLGLVHNDSSKAKVRIHKTGSMRLDKWWKRMRLHALRRLLGGGFVNHYFEGNKQVLECLPVIMTDYALGEGETKTSRKSLGLKSKEKKGRFSDHRKFLGVLDD